MRAALYLSTLCGHLRRELQEKLDRDLASLPLPSLPDQLKASAIQERLKWDKKSKNGRLRFVLLKDLGHPVLDPNVPPFAIIQTIEWLLSQGVKQPSKKRVS
jgi:3-dehydroquinate synthetase